MISNINSAYERHDAGGVPTTLTEVPLAASSLYPTTYNWGAHGEPQPGFCSGCLDKGASSGHGKGLGGGSIINLMIFVRGNEGDYNKWEEMGNPGWGYRDVLPYFCKLEDASNVAWNDSQYRGTGGPLSVSSVSYRTKLTDVYIEAAQQAGYPYVDYNGKQQIGISHMQATLRNGMRSNAENSYLRPSRQRQNLKIRIGAYVTKILIKPDTKEAYGVEYKKNGIPVIKPLPVGETMYDHVGFAGAMFLLNEHIGCENLAFDSDEYWECAIRSMPSSTWHQQCACKMGPETDKEAVVDPRLRVHGIKNLRVVDVSIFPTTVAAHTVGPAYMVGEKAADIIKEDWNAASN
ncbi:unnamed protein product [Acanthoscelides obtectus]|uniref:Glucose-methanol-choline oxidoreductase N-terminal domain-containing protein n=1 Tax=Acanthoscelides obtectus TaxID=200917 RepID=A0A9P0PHP4_ACAOB|nr:unnamed protein product [Acanthoscelides obtectus]CAK1679687.1 Glucose dehydrogenase [FAD, quinone] [Acanthoscelides obtectus]